ncbi:hypothetical protein KC338_g274 [Hortaea werneckii]|nr:hypothetical protein KC338_g274 [Hortaea werneckii]
MHDSCLRSLRNQEFRIDCLEIMRHTIKFRFRSDKYPQASEMLYPRRRAPAKRSSKGAIRLLESATDSCVKLIKTV